MTITIEGNQDYYDEGWHDGLTRRHHSPNTGNGNKETGIVLFVMFSIIIGVPALFQIIKWIDEICQCCLKRRRSGRTLPPDHHAMDSTIDGRRNRRWFGGGITEQAPKNGPSRSPLRRQDSDFELQSLAESTASLTGPAIPARAFV